MQATGLKTEHNSGY